MNYFIRDKVLAEGPYDLMAMIRKIRNRTVVQTTLISAGAGGEPKAAGEWKELEEFFQDGDEDSSATDFVRIKPSHNFQELLGQNINFLKGNPAIAMYSGIFMVGWLLVGMLFLFERDIIKSLIGITLSYFFMGGYLYGMHKYVRGNPVRTSDVLAKMLSSAFPMLTVSLVVALLMVPGLIIAYYILPPEKLSVSLPILFSLLFLIMTFFAFTPLLIVHKRRHVLEAILESIRLVLRHKGENLGIVFGLTTLNFLFLPVLPIVLPITSAALVELYEESMS